MSLRDPSGIPSRFLRDRSGQGLSFTGNLLYWLAGNWLQPLTDTGTTQTHTHTRIGKTHTHMGWTIKLDIAFLELTQRHAS